MTVSQDVEIEGRTLRVTNLDKVLYPNGFTKAQVIDYYIRVAPALLRHLAGRPITLKRYPNGTEGQFFYEKNCPSHRPEWVNTVKVPRARGDERFITYCTVDDLPTLVWLANLAAIELHPLLARAVDVDSPTHVVFDLDPGPPAGLLECARVGCLVRQELDGMGLQCFPKTSGSKGLQLYVPLNRPHTYEQTKPFAHRLAAALARRHPELVVEKMDKSLRKGKVLIDWSQNHPTKTTVGPYSLRARERPTVSTPVRWGEVEDLLAGGDASQLAFDATQVLDRLNEEGDLFEPVATLHQELPV
ncbi:MAG TPA: non-homologous end-joining DNA ligase [Acidimicrobiales bacterium]|nr:non-homologous end-joining DNA ligase [Acidimicrobiales bacterium]